MNVLNIVIHWIRFACAPVASATILLGLALRNLTIPRMFRPYVARRWMMATPSLAFVPLPLLGAPSDYYARDDPR
jgi:hypothetical protein